MAQPTQPRFHRDREHETHFVDHADRSSVADSRARVEVQRATDAALKNILQNGTAAQRAAATDPNNPGAQALLNRQSPDAKAQARGTYASPESPGFFRAFGPGSKGNTTPFWNNTFRQPTVNPQLKAMPNTGSGVMTRTMQQQIIPPLNTGVGGMAGSAASFFSGAVGQAANMANAAASTPAPPKQGDTRTTATGGTETFMPSQSGGRWVGGVANPPPVNNAAGQVSNAGNPAATAQMNPIAMRPTKPGDPVATVGQNRDFYAAPTTAGTAVPLWNASKDSPRIQAMLDAAAKPAVAAAQPWQPAKGDFAYPVHGKPVPAPPPAETKSDLAVNQNNGVAGPTGDSTPGVDAPTVPRNTGNRDQQLPPPAYAAGQAARQAIVSAPGNAAKAAGAAIDSAGAAVNSVVIPKVTTAGDWAKGLFGMDAIPQPNVPNGGPNPPPRGPSNIGPQQGSGGRGWRGPATPAGSPPLSDANGAPAPFDFSAAAKKSIVDNTDEEEPAFSYS